MFKKEHEMRILIRECIQDGKSHSQIFNTLLSRFPHELALKREISTYPATDLYIKHKALITGNYILTISANLFYLIISLIHYENTFMWFLYHSIFLPILLIQKSSLKHGTNFGVASGIFSSIIVFMLLFSAFLHLDQLFLRMLFGLSTLIMFANLWLLIKFHGINPFKEKPLT